MQGVCCLQYLMTCSAYHNSFKYKGTLLWNFISDKINYSCGLSTATIEYSCPSVCLSVCLSWCVCVCVHDNSKNNFSVDLKLEHIVVYDNSSDEFDIGHCPIKVKVTAFTTIQTVKAHILALAHVRKL